MNFARLSSILACAAAYSLLSFAAAHAQDDDTLCADRPMKAYGYCTVQPQHFQVEADIFNGSFHKQDGVTTDTELFINPVFKYGLNANSDIEVAIDPLERIVTRSNGSQQIVTGASDLTMQMKFKTFDDGKLQSAIIPSITAPTGHSGITSGVWTGSVTIPIQYTLSPKWQVTFQSGLDSQKNQLGPGEHLENSELVNVQRVLTSNINVSGELWADYNFDPHGVVRQYTADISIAWMPYKDLQFDCGAYFGLNKSTPGVQIYIGVSKLFGKF